VVNDLGDNGNVTGGRSVVDENDSADLDESLEGGWLLRLEVSSVHVLSSWVGCLVSVVCLSGHVLSLLLLYSLSIYYAR
jgi:hypothetical protein